MRAWLAGTVPDFGFVIRDPMEITAGASRPGLGLSRENPNAALAPYLRIEFAESFGNGCTTHASTPTYDFASGKTIMGDLIDLRVSGTLPGSFGIAIFGLSNTQWGGGSLPFPLTALGYPGCDLNVDPGGSVIIGIMANATTLFPILMPTAAAFSGMSLYSQVFVLTPTAAIEVSNGLGVAVWL